MEGILLQGDRDPVELADLPPFVRTSRSMVEALRRSLADVEAEHIRDTLASVQGNKTRCAKILGIDRKTLREKMRIYDL
jgi:DNA-binding NtrC family response regulator